MATISNSGSEAARLLQDEPRTAQNLNPTVRSSHCHCRLEPESTRARQSETTDRPRFLRNSSRCGKHPAHWQAVSAKGASGQSSESWKCTSRSARAHVVPAGTSSIPPVLVKVVHVRAAVNYNINSLYVHLRVTQYKNELEE